MKKKLFIISNESIYNHNGNFLCDNLDLKSIPEELNKNFEVHLIGRKSKKMRTLKIDIKNIKLISNIFSLLKILFQSTKEDRKKYLLISISPFTFLSMLILKLFGQKISLYLRSDGFKEYKSIIGFYGPAIYHFMFFFVVRLSNLIACRKHLLRGHKGEIVSPSHLNDNWLRNYSPPDLKSVKLLYIGRLKVEKGIFSLFKILENSNINLIAVTSEKEINLNKVFKNINILSFENYNDTIIKFYDENNVFILPSFTEAHPQVLDEALARQRSVIIFSEISHVVRDRKGVFTAERNLNSLNEKINYIMKNYHIIQDDLKKNRLPTKSQFINQLTQILSN